MADLERLDPESEDEFASLTEAIAWELGARIAAGDDTRTQAGQKALAELIADTVIDRFVVRARQTPRYRPRTEGT